MQLFHLNLKKNYLHSKDILRFSPNVACEFIHFVGFDILNDFKSFVINSVFGLRKNSKNPSAHTKMVMFTKVIA